MSIETILLANAMLPFRSPTDSRCLGRRSVARCNAEAPLLTFASSIRNGSIPIENSGRGVWAITEAGEDLSPTDVDKVLQTVRRQDEERRRAHGGADEVSAKEAVAAEPPLPEEGWKDGLLKALRAMAPDACERLAQRLLRESGFVKVEVTGRSGDGGIDVLRINLISFQVLFQCKRYQGSVGSGTVRDFRGAMVGRSDKGLIITTGMFSGDAKREATRAGAPAIVLIEGDTLCDLLKGLKLGVATEMVERVVIDADWFARV